MASERIYAVVRIILLGLAAAIGYVVVYIPLMELLFDKRQPLSFFIVLFLSLAMAATFARFADRRLPPCRGA